MRDAPTDVPVPHAARCRTGPGCLFFEMNPGVADAEAVTLAECFASEEAHRVHCETQWFRDCWARWHRPGLEGRSENVRPRRVVPDRADFAAGA